jgi:hypothetical protein
MNVLRFDIIPDGYFQAASQTLGSSEDELSAVERGEVSVERFGIIMDNLKHAANALWWVPVQGRC